MRLTYPNSIFNHRVLTVLNSVLVFGFLAFLPHLTLAVFLHFSIKYDQLFLSAVSPFF